MVLGLLVNIGAHLALATGTVTDQFIQLDRLPMLDVALIEKE